MMKRLLGMVLGLMCAAGALAQEKVLIDEEDRWNLFTRLDFKHSDLGPGSTWLGGVQVGGVLNERYGVGVAGYANIEDFNEAPAGYKLPQTLDLFYGGVVAEYRILMEQVFHLSLGAMVGIGRLDVERAATRAKDELRFSLVEPQISVALHLTKTIDLGAGLGYRFFDFRREDPAWKSGDFEGLVTTLYLRFTEF